MSSQQPQSYLFRSGSLKIGSTKHNGWPVWAHIKPPAPFTYKSTILSTSPKWDAQAPIVRWDDINFEPGLGPVRGGQAHTDAKKRIRDLWIKRYERSNSAVKKSQPPALSSSDGPRSSQKKSTNNNKTALEDNALEREGIANAAEPTQSTAQAKLEMKKNKPIIETSADPDSGTSNDLADETLQVRPAVKTVRDNKHNARSSVAGASPALKRKADAIPSDFVRPGTFTNPSSSKKTPKLSHTAVSRLIKDQTSDSNGTDINPASQSLNKADDIIPKEADIPTVLPASLASSPSKDPQNQASKSFAIPTPSESLTPFSNTQTNLSPPSSSSSSSSSVSDIIRKVAIKRDFIHKKFIAEEAERKLLLSKSRKRIDEWKERLGKVEATLETLRGMPVEASLKFGGAIALGVAEGDKSEGDNGKSVKRELKREVKREAKREG